MKDHHLKTWPSPFAAVRSGLKPFDYRVDDRGFAIGDRLFLEEWDPVTVAYTGQVEIRVVGYILLGGQFGLPPSYVVMGFAVSAAERDVLAERRRHVQVEGWSPEHDDAHAAGELTLAAACYALHCVAVVNDETEPGLLGRLWPWSIGWWKPRGQRKDLVRAASLIIAEIDKVDRAAARGGDA